MAPKREPSKASVEDAAGKKRKAEDDGAKKDGKKAHTEEAEKETDAQPDKRPQLKEPIVFDSMDTTLNVIPALGGKMLMVHADGGMQYFIAGARGNVGIKSGRYVFEARIVESLNPAEVVAGAKRSGPTPRQLVRLGFSTSCSELILGESVDSICFDGDGMLISDRKKMPGKSQRFGRDHVMAVVLNLDANSPNVNTVSLFRDGVRITDAQPLPECLIGKPLFPHICYRNVSIQVNFGPQLMKALPFKCRMIQSAAQADVEVAPSSKPKLGKYEVLLPVGFPDEGTFDWLDAFMKKNPRYVELSDRKIIDWAAKSGMLKGKGPKESNDKPEFNFGISAMDDYSIQRVIRSVAPLVPRNYVIMEVKENLVAADRANTLRRFTPSVYKRIASVQMGEPTTEYKELQQEMLLKAKQERANAEWRARRTEKERKKQIEFRQKQLEEMRKKAEEARNKAIEDARRRAAEATKKFKADAGIEVKEEAPEDAEMKEEVKEEPKEEVKEEVKKEDEEMEVKEEENEDQREPPTVELTDEEKAIVFRELPQSDLLPLALSQSFGDFAVPEKSEGFDEIRFEWQNAAKSKEYLRTWVLEKKRTARIEDLQPGKWFLERNAEWLKTFKIWESKQKAFKNQEKKKRNKKEDEEDDKDDEVDHVDIFSVKDVCDVGNGEPLFAKFGYEDWAMMQLRYELYLLIQAYRKDVNDDERIGIHEPHIAFYYNKYFHKTLSPKNFGHSTNADICEMLKDTVSINPQDQILASQLAGDITTLDHFAKLTEEQRRERQRRIDAGDETARLHFTQQAMQTPQPPRSVSITPVTAGALAANAAASAAKAWAMKGAKGAWPGKGASRVR